MDADRPDAFTKRRADAPPGFFAVEAAGLAWLADAADRGGVAVPRALEVTATSIAVPRVAQVAPTATAAAQLGRRLAATHAAGAVRFGAPPAGWDGDGFIATLPLPHLHPTGPGRGGGGDGEGPAAEARTGTAAAHDDGAPAPGGPAWGAFYARCRVQPFLRAARDAGAVDAAGARLVDAVTSRLEEGAFDDGRPPARLHGDLWSGNVLWGAGGAVLVDPAAHGGHAETDLAMLALFGLPHLERVLAAYDEAAPLAAGWRERVDLHQLHPLLVHAALFGGAYGAAAVAAAERVLAS